MANEKTKTKALKELGEKVTGKTLNNKATIVGMIGEITKNYEGGAGGGAGVGKLTITASGGTPALDETSIAYLNTLTPDNLPASFLITVNNGDSSASYMYYFSNIDLSEGESYLNLYTYNAGTKEHGSLVLSQNGETWEVREPEG